MNFLRFDVERVNTELLGEQLLSDLGDGYLGHRLNGRSLTVYFADSVDPEQVRGVVQSHDPDGETAQQQEIRVLMAYDSATATDELTKQAVSWILDRLLGR